MECVLSLAPSLVQSLFFQALPTFKKQLPPSPPSQRAEHFSISLWPFVSVLSEKFEHHHSLFQSERVKLSGRRNLEKQRNKQSSVASQWQLEARFVNLSAEHENLE